MSVNNKETDFEHCDCEKNQRGW